jgi:hypothetical protein
MENIKPFIPCFCASSDMKQDSFHELSDCALRFSVPLQRDAVNRGMPLDEAQETPSSVCIVILGRHGVVIRHNFLGPQPTVWAKIVTVT